MSSISSPYPDFHGEKLQARSFSLSDDVMRETIPISRCKQKHLLSLIITAGWRVSYFPSPPCRCAKRPMMMVLATPRLCGGRQHGHRCLASNRQCLDVGACLEVNTRALGRGALHKKVDSIPLLLTSEEIGLL